jgi:hypothetical protein
MSNFTESVVEDVALAWLESLGYAVLHGLEIAAGIFVCIESFPIDVLPFGGSLMSGLLPFRSRKGVEMRLYSVDEMPVKGDGAIIIRSQV